MPTSFHARVQRQDGPNAAPYVQTFEIAHEPGMNVHTVLQEIAARPVTTDGTQTTPVAWDANCLEEVCGSCSMIINGKVQQACAALVDNLIGRDRTADGHPPVIDIRPMTKFPVIRDLVVDRSRMFAALKRIRGWIPVDTYNHLGEGPVVPPEVQDMRYPLSRCMTCGCCLEVCPQVNERSEFIGPHAIAQAVLFNMHPTGAMTGAERLEGLMGPGGLADCGNAQNCVKICPKGVPLTWSIGKAGRELTVHSIRRFFLK